jgi:hypothetical protein
MWHQPALLCWYLPTAAFHHLFLIPQMSLGYVKLPLHLSRHLPSAKASWGLFLLPVHRDNLVVKASNGFQWHEKLHRLWWLRLSLCWVIIFFLIVHVQLTSKVRVNGACRTRDNKCKSATRWSRTCVEGVDGNVAQARSSWVLFMLVPQASPSNLELFQIKYAYIIIVTVCISLYIKVYKSLSLDVNRLGRYIVAIQSVDELPVVWDNSRSYLESFHSSPLGL